MGNKIWHAVGTMSGTSLDGLDLVLVKFTCNSKYSFEILRSESIKYSEKWKKRLYRAFDGSADEISRLHVEYGAYVADRIQEFIESAEVPEPDLIASHGHTVFHRPDKGYTVQIGSGAVIAARTGCKVVCDFRAQDVALGGQGAPLVPVGDALLFSKYDFCLNLGGFANVSFDQEGERKAFDVCPVNIVLNHYSRQIGQEYDDRGQVAAGAVLHEDLLRELNQLSFYGADRPKSLGYEFVVEQVFPMIDSFGLPVADVLRTFVEHAAQQIALVIHRAKCASGSGSPEVLVTGGGAFNEFLVERLRELSGSRIVLPSREIIEFKEALIFAFLGLLRVQNKINCLKSVTGAAVDHSSGIVYHINSME